MILKRIKQFIDYKGIAVSAFEKSIGMANASFGKSLKNGGTIGADKLEIILKVYPDLNAEWLLRGVGEMLTQSEDSVMKNPTLDFVIRHMASQIDELKAQVKYLEAKNDELRDERDDLAERNHELEKDLARKGEIASIVGGSSDANVG